MRTTSRGTAEPALRSGALIAATPEGATPWLLSDFPPDSRHYRCAAFKNRNDKSIKPLRISPLCRLSVEELKYDQDHAAEAKRQEHDRFIAEKIGLN
jgi:hypothetical protein